MKGAMMRMLLWPILFLAAPAQAQLAIVAPRVDLSTMARKSDLPSPSDTVGGAEAVGGAVGVATTYKRGDWVPPRISRTGSCVLSASGTCTLTWSTAFAAGVVPVMLGEPVVINSAAAQPIDCDVTSAPTIAGVAIKCWAAQSTLLNLTLITAGLTLAPFQTSSLNGLTVTAAAFPGT